jgi:hypothetical protein
MAIVPSWFSLCVLPIAHDAVHDGLLLGGEFPSFELSALHSGIAIPLSLVVIHSAVEAHESAIDFFRRWFSAMAEVHIICSFCSRWHSIPGCIPVHILGIPAEDVLLASSYAASSVPAFRTAD